jgi:Transposase DDE domain
VVAIHPHEAALAAARVRQRDPAWLADYRATRPKVERKLAHLLRRRHGGRRARVRGLVRITQDFKLLAAAVNLARFATLGLRHTSAGWQVQRPQLREAGAESWRPLHHGPDRLLWRHLENLPVGRDRQHRRISSIRRQMHTIARPFAAVATPAPAGR